MVKRGCFIDVSERAVVALRGAESLDLLQRISTNDVINLNTIGCLQTVLANEKGRIVDVVSLLYDGAEGLLVMGQSTDPSILKQWIEKYVIMENITVTVLTGKFKHLMIYDSMQKIEDLAVHLGSCRVFEENFGSGKLVHVLAAMEVRDAAIKWLQDFGFVESERSAYEKHRVTHGIPGFPGELSASYNPLEAGLLHLVSFTKGCYIGQEVVARLDTHKKVQRRLVKLKMIELPERLPESIYLGSAEWGSITSAVRLTDSHDCVGLGYVKIGSERSYDELHFLNGGNEIKLVIES